MPPDSGSFRDPAGRVVIENGRIVRHVDASYARHYDAFHASPLSRRLRDRGWLIDYEEIDPGVDGPYKKLECERIPFVSYPYEWSFSQLKDAALLTLQIQTALLEKGFVLKDATPFNVQFRGTSPVFIDLLSFEVRREGDPWIAYRQFCESFLAPLLLMAHVDPAMADLLRTHLDGVPLSLCSKLLPLTVKIRPLIFLHVVLHSKMGRSRDVARPVDEAEAEAGAGSGREIGTESLLSIARQLSSVVRKIRPSSGRSFWSSYYESHLNYTEAAFEEKKERLEGVVERIRPETVWDLGSNLGVFSRICARFGARVVAFDSDPGCVDELYRRLRDESGESILPLRVDLANPSPGLGWANRERKTILERGPADLILALGLVHHLRLGHNVPFELQAELFARCGRWLLVEFVAAEDEMARLLGAHKPELLADHQEERFVDAFENVFRVEDTMPLGESRRKLFLMRSTVCDE